MSPEQITAPARVGPASDVFAFGSVLVFAATGQGPFSGGDTWSAMHRITSGAPDLTRVPADLLALTSACLRPDPAARPTPEQIIRALADQVPDGDWLPPAARAMIVAVAPAATRGDLAEPTAADPPGLREEINAARREGLAGRPLAAGDKLRPLYQAAGKQRGFNHQDTLALFQHLLHWLETAGHTHEAAELWTDLLAASRRNLGDRHQTTRFAQEGHDKLITHLDQRHLLLTADLLDQLRALTPTSPAGILTGVDRPTRRLPFATDLERIQAAGIMYEHDEVPLATYEVRSPALPADTDQDRRHDPDQYYLYIDPTTSPADLRSFRYQGDRPGQERISIS